MSIHASRGPDNHSGHHMTGHPAASEAAPPDPPLAACRVHFRRRLLEAAASDNRLANAARRILELAIALDADDTAADICRLREALPLAEATIYRALRCLVEYGYMRHDGRTSSPHGRPRRCYRITLPRK